MPATSHATPALAGSLAHSWAGADRGPVTLVLHGGGPGCHATSDFAHVIALLPQRRWLCVDLPGYGRSAPLPADAGPSRMSALAAALALELERTGLERVDVLAQSLGGAVALRLAARSPATVRRIVLIGSQPSTTLTGTRDPGLGARARAEYYGGDGPSQDKMRRLIATLEWHDGTAVPAETVLARYRASITPAAQAPVSPPLDAANGDALADVRCPTLVMWGRHDPFAGPDYAAALADALPRGDVVVVGRTAHHPQAERPEIVAAFADAFLSRGS